MVFNIKHDQKSSFPGKNQFKKAPKFLFKMYEIKTQEYIDHLLDAYTKSTSEIDFTEILEKNK